MTLEKEYLLGTKCESVVEIKLVFWFAGYKLMLAWFRACFGRNDRLTVCKGHLYNKYDVVVLALHSKGQSLLTYVWDKKLRVGNVFLFDTGSTFEHRFRNNDAFSLITVMPESSPPKRLQMQAAMFLKAVMVGTQIVDSALDNEGLIDIFTAAFLTASLMLLTRYLRDDQAQNNINWWVFITIAFAIAYSKNLEKAGLSQAIANTFIKISRGINTKRAPYVAIYIVSCTCI